MKAKGTVFLVEDNTELNTNNARALRLLGYEVHPALTLADARIWLGENEPDIILLDVMLPDGDGIDFCAEIRGAPLWTAAHILFLTARMAHADRVRGLLNGGDDYIIKPFHPEELLARVDAAMRRRRMGPGDQQDALSVREAGERKFRAFATHYDLTEKESEVLSLVLRKLRTREIAESMGISGKGVEFHITHILLKIGVGRRRDVVQVYADWDPSFFRKKT